jgi:CARDB
MNRPIIHTALPTAMFLILALPASAQDLHPTKISKSNGVVQPGEKFTVSSTIKNVGLLFGTGKSVASAYYLSKNPIFISLPLVKLGSFTTPALGPGKSNNHSMTVTMPRNITSRQYYLFVWADNKNQLLESNELNNIRSTGIVGTHTDLTVNLTAPGPLTAGTSINVKVTANNLGTLHSKPTRALLFLSMDAFIKTTDVYLGSVDVPAVAGRKSLAVNRVVSLPHCHSIYTLLGLTSLGVIINPATATRVPEGNYNNNTSLLIRKVNPSTVKGRILQWWPTFREDDLGPTTNGAARFRLPSESATGRLCITAPNDTLAQYLIVMSGSATFNWDMFSDIGFANLNSVMFPRWFGNVGLAGRRSDIGLFIPRIDAHGFRVYIHHYYFNPKGYSSGNNTVHADFIK